ncbi:MAG TPA: YebC/PmpR family DNA-binding transcriptional regulator, partial [Thermodesulforhabdus norvegica]|nr:YebC/PmpR family DNA-binding transcriptional regulator [Thermodesulforhabdus norvegica]
NRTISEIRHIFTKNGGSLGEAGCVAWMFNKKGLIVFPKDKYTEDELMEVALEAGAEDVRDQGDQFEVLTDPADFLKVKQVFDEHSMQYELAEISMIPQTVVKIEDPKQAQQVIRLMELLEDHDDVQHAYANFDIPDELLKSIAA